MPKPEKLTQAELLAIIEQEERNSLGWSTSLLSKQRATAMDYYMGEPFGNEVEGRSQVVSREVMDTVEWIMPSIVKIFTAGDNVVRFDPQGPEDQDAAKQVTDTVNYVVQRLNDGFCLLHNWFKDALLQKNGFVKVYWEEYDEVKRETYEGLTDNELAMLVGPKDVEVIAHTEYQGEIVLPGSPPAPATLHDVQVKTTAKSGRICAQNIPPEEILLHKQTRSIKDCKFIAHRSLKTISELREQGFDVEGLTDTDDIDTSQETLSRYRKEEDTSFVRTQEMDDSTREIWVTEAYLLVDYDGDGIAELRKVIKAGSKILENEEAENRPILSITPILMPHKLIGLSLADLVTDLQFIKSHVWRQLMDGMYINNNPRTMVLDGMVNLDDMMVSRPGGIIRVKAFDAVKPFPVSPAPAGAYNLLEYLDSVRENRTGVTRYNQGVDANSLNKTAHGIDQIMSASQQRIELIARVFAETGVKDLFWKVLELLQKHSTRTQQIRLNGKWVEVDPREWSTRFDMSVSVGLGTGSKEKSLAILQGVLAIQGELKKVGSPIVTDQNIYYSSLEYCKAAELKGAELFFTDPSQAPPQQHAPDPALAIAQMDNQTKMQMASEKNQLAQWKTLVQAEVKRQMAEMQQSHSADQAALDRMHETNRHGAEITHDAMGRQHDLNMSALNALMKPAVGPTGPQ